MKIVQQSVVSSRFRAATWLEPELMLMTLLPTIIIDGEIETICA